MVLVDIQMLLAKPILSLNGLKLVRAVLKQPRTFNAILLILLLPLWRRSKGLSYAIFFFFSYIHEKPSRYVHIPKGGEPKKFKGMSTSNIYVLFNANHSYMYSKNLKLLVLCTIFLLQLAALIFSWSTLGTDDDLRLLLTFFTTKTFKRNGACIPV